MHWKKCYSTEHLDSIDLDGKAVTITITGAEPIKIAGEQGEQSKALIRFRGRTKTTWVIPITVARSLAAMFGDDMAGWAGKRVTVHAEQVEAFGEMVEAIRPIGSPDITKPVRFKVRKGRKRVTLEMRPTGKPPAADVSELRDEPPPVDEIEGAA